MAEATVGTAKAGEAAVGAVSTGNAVSSDVSVHLTLTKAVGKSGFGIPLILAGKQNGFDAENIRERLRELYV